jgi:hypothetical protein
MKIEIVRQRVPDMIKTGDGVMIEGFGECMVIEITDEAAGNFNAMAPTGVVIPLRLRFPTEVEAPHTLQ